ncbi:50S ribosomal protein L37ae [Candidatus Woesearchaeota archaeon]|nr:50S ribosomal protein L37ae [Candidatus Woesearchaeota archaeon]
MAKKVKLGSTKRYGTRYGRRNKEKVAALEKEHRGRHKCPYCNYVRVIRLAKGIWNCEKCGARFAGKAYTYDIQKKPAVIPPGPAEQPPEEEEILEEEDYDEDEDEESQEEPDEEKKSEVE